MRGRDRMKEKKGTEEVKTEEKRGKGGRRGERKGKKNKHRRGKKDKMRIKENKGGEKRKG